ncbi:AAA family ATPase [Sphingopyxis flava]|uniref:AAA domain-containing protein n=1 Tax=Sphingopyxis flava TaxID=1507287 RepID=A0A1T5G2P0_9SPHN|nr:AAA family ATPase [Sphingopyxis flava]SKC02534.1 AAA domain-containing protein [Sphingopyxis flava]
MTSSLYENGDSVRNPDAIREKPSEFESGDHAAEPPELTAYLEGAEGGQGGTGPTAPWSNIPIELRQRPQWCLAANDKRPLALDGRNASVSDPSTWTDFDAARRCAELRGCGIGYVLTADDPFSCIDLDVKDGTGPEALQRYHSVIETFDSYTEHSRSGLGFHVWVRGKIGEGRRRDGVEVYSQARFIICTGSVVRDRPIADRQDVLSNMVAQMASEAPAKLELWGDDHADWDAATRAAEDTGELGRLFAGDWKGRYPSQSEADLALVKLLIPLTESPRECWLTFRLSKLGERDKAKRTGYAQSTMAQAMQHYHNDAEQLRHGEAMAAGLLRQTASSPTTDQLQADAEIPSLLDRLSVDWTAPVDADVPDVVEGLVADEEVTLLGGHGGVGKGFLALQMACAVALGEPILNHPTRQCRVLYYSAEDGRKRLTRGLRRVAQQFDYDEKKLRQNLRVLDASEIDPLYSERLESGADGKRAAKVLGGTAEFDRLREMVKIFDPQLVVVDGASDTFDGNEIARREVRGFIKMLRRVHPCRNIGVLLIVHIDRSSARGNTTNDDGYAGSAQWHNSSRRRMFLQHQIDKEWDSDLRKEVVVGERFMLRVMKNQDGVTQPDLQLQRGEWGLWQLAVEIGDDLALGVNAGTDHAATLARLIGEYYARGKYISTSLAPQASTGAYAMLKDDPEFPQGLKRKRTIDLMRGLERDGVLAAEPYQRPNRSWAERWTVLRDPNNPFRQFAPGAQTGTV